MSGFRLTADMLLKMLNEDEVSHEQVTKIDMPKLGTYLILDFISSHTLHWVENLQSTNNEFIFLVQDI